MLDERETDLLERFGYGYGVANWREMCWVTGLKAYNKGIRAATITKLELHLYENETMDGCLEYIRHITL